MRKSLFGLLGLSFLSVAARTWEEAHSLARTYVQSLSLDDKLKLVKGDGGLLGGRCVGITASVKGNITIPEICLQDGPAGLRNIKKVSAFPAGNTVAATWNRALMRARGVALGAEWKARGAHVFLGPAIDVTRAPQGGRAWESFGADPYLNGEAAFETIVGVQSQGVQACAKHLIGYHQEHFRFDMSVTIDDRTLRETYFKPFQRAIDAGVTCVMCSYNKLKGSWACRDPSLTGSGGLLRGEGGFQGYVVSDWGATHGGAFRTSEVHQTVEAGVDLEMPGGFMIVGGGVYDHLKAAVEQKTVSMEAVDTMVERFIAGWLKVDQDKARHPAECSLCGIQNTHDFQTHWCSCDSQGFPQISFDVHGKSESTVSARSQEHTDLIRRIGAAGTVLLKNSQNVLPLVKPKSLAVVGVDASDIKNKDCDEMNACDFEGTVPVGWGSGSNSLDDVVAPFQAIQDMLKVESPSTQVLSSLSQDTKSAQDVSSKSEVAVVFVYAFSGEIGTGVTNVDGNYGDRKDLKLWKGGDSLIQAVASQNSKTIVVMHSVGPVVIEAWADHPNVTAIIMAGLPGEQTGPAISDVLFGRVNPSGRLPYTIAKDEKDYGVNVSPYNILKSGFSPSIDYTEGLLTDYKRFDAQNIVPRYPFGHGISYTNFTYKDLKIASSNANEGKYQLTVSITNSGSRQGTEIVQLYLGFPTGSGEPPKLLRGFEAIDLPSGKEAIVTFNLGTNDLTIYDTNQHKYVRPSGTYTAYVGASSRDIRLQNTF